MKRALIYIALVVVFIVAIVIKIGVIKEKESATVVSILGEWQRDGIPVEAYKVDRQDLVRLEKLTGEVKSPRLLEAAVSSSLTRSLNAGDRVFAVTENGSINGSVRSVARSAGPTGLFRVEISLSTPVSEPAGSILPVDVEVERLSKRLVVPSSALRTVDGKTYVWKLVDGAAEQTEVASGPSAGGFVEITQGLKEGDQVVARGQSNLQSDLGVQIIETL